MFQAEVNSKLEEFDGDGLFRKFSLGAEGQERDVLLPPK